MEHRGAPAFDWRLLECSPFEQFLFRPQIAVFRIPQPPWLVVVFTGGILGYVGQNPIADLHVGKQNHASLGNKLVIKVLVAFLGMLLCDSAHIQEHDQNLGTELQFAANT